jgi:hypothetical protein
MISPVGKKKGDPKAALVELIHWWQPSRRVTHWGEVDAFTVPLPEALAAIHSQRIATIR